MGALSKIAKEGVESLTDFLKRFSDKTYYHGTVSDIKSFEPQEKYYLKPGISKHLAIFPGDYEKRGGEFILDQPKLQLPDLRG